MEKNQLVKPNTPVLACSSEQIFLSLLLLLLLPPPCGMERQDLADLSPIP